MYMSLKADSLFPYQSLFGLNNIQLFTGKEITGYTLETGFKTKRLPLLRSSPANEKLYSIRGKGMSPMKITFCYIRRVCI